MKSSRINVVSDEDSVLARSCPGLRRAEKCVSGGILSVGKLRAGGCSAAGLQVEVRLWGWQLAELGRGDAAACAAKVPELPDDEDVARTYRLAAEAAVTRMHRRMGHRCASARAPASSYGDDCESVDHEESADYDDDADYDDYGTEYDEEDDEEDEEEEEEEEEEEDSFGDEEESDYGDWSESEEEFDEEESVHGRGRNAAIPEEVEEDEEEDELDDFGEEDEDEEEEEEELEEDNEHDFEEDESYYDAEGGDY